MYIVYSSRHCKCLRSPKKSKISIYEVSLPFYIYMPFLQWLKTTAYDDEWVVRSRVLAKKKHYSNFSDDFINDCFAPSPPTSPQAKENVDMKVKKTPLEKKLKKLASLKKNPPPWIVTTEEFTIKYSLPNCGKNPHILYQHTQAYTKCKGEEVLH